MAGLAGNKLKDIYKGFLHLADHLGITNLLKKVQDGDGVDTGIELSTTDIKFTKKISSSAVSAASADTDKFMVLDGEEVKYRTGAQVLSDIGLGNVDNTSDANKPVSSAQQTAIDLAISNLKDGVATPGDTLNKLYNIIIGQTKEVTVADIAARNALNIVSLPTNVFVTDDGDGKWALYKATTTGTGATFVKLSDPDLLNAVMSAATIKSSYESNADTNAFTNAFKAIVQATSGTNTGDETAARIATINHGATAKSTPVDADEITGQDSANAWGLIRVTFLNFWLYIKSKADSIYQATLVSGTNIKSINSQSILGSGNLTVSGASIQLLSVTLNANQDDYTIAGMSTSKDILTILRIKPGTTGMSLKITGFNKTISAVDVEDGKRIRIVNDSDSLSAGAGLILFERFHSASGSAAANRISNLLSNGMCFILCPGASVDYVRNNTTNLWEYVSSSDGYSPNQFFDLYTDCIIGTAQGITPFMRQDSGTGTLDTSSQEGMAATQKQFGSMSIGVTATNARQHIGTQNSAIFGGAFSMLGMVRLKPNALSDATDEYILPFGFHDATSANTPTDAFMWVYDRLNATDWRTAAGKAGSINYVTETGFTPSTTVYHYLGVFINGDGTRGDFFYSTNGETWNIAASQTISGGMNSSNAFGFLVGMNKTAGTSNKKTWIDWLGLKILGKRGA